MSEKLVLNLTLSVRVGEQSDGYTILMALRQIALFGSITNLSKATPRYDRSQISLIFLLHVGSARVVTHANGFTSKKSVIRI